MTEKNICCATGCSSAPEADHRMPLCPPCRRKFAGRAFPKEIKLAAIGVLIALVVGIALSPASLRAAIAFERGERAESHGDYAAAAEQFREVIEAYPQSPKVIIRLAVTLKKSGHAEEALDLINTRLAGRKLPREIIQEAEKLFERRGEPRTNSSEGF